MKMKLPVSCLAFLALCAGCGEQKQPAPETGVVAESISTVDVNGKQVAKEVVKAETVTPAQAQAQMQSQEPVSIRAPKLWAFLPDVVAKVNGKDVTKAEFIEYLAAQTPNGEIPASMSNPAMLQQIAPSLIKNYVDRPLLLAAAEKAGFKASPELVNTTVRAQFKQIPAEDFEAFKKQLESQGKTVDGFVAELAANPKMQENIALEAYMEKIASEGAPVTDEEAQKFYDANKAYFVKGDPAGTIRASHILIEAKKTATPEEMATARKKAEEILAQLKKDQTQFEALAEKESACPSGKQNKGSLGAFQPNDMVKEFSEAAFKLKEGEISGIVQTDFGFHIIRRDKSVAQTTIPFADVKKDIVNMLKGQKNQAVVAATIQKLEQENKVEFLYQAPKPQLPAAAPASAAAPQEKAQPAKEAPAKEQPKAEAAK